MWIFPTFLFKSCQLWTLWWLLSTIWINGTVKWLAASHLNVELFWRQKCGLKCTVSETYQISTLVTVFSICWLMCTLQGWVTLGSTTSSSTHGHTLVTFWRLVILFWGRFFFSPLLIMRSITKVAAANFLGFMCSWVIKQLPNRSFKGSIVRRGRCVVRWGRVRWGRSGVRQSGIVVRRARAVGRLLVSVWS